MSSNHQKMADLKHVLKLFYKSGHLMPQKEAMIRARYHGKWTSQDLLFDLQKCELLVPYRSEKSVKMGDELRVNPALNDHVRKFILEDHVTQPLGAKLATLL